jgi:hypothetical protein
MWWKHRGAHELRELLTRYWDPIGVYGVPEARGEYDGYMSPVIARLERGGSEKELTKHLIWIERDWMDVRPDKERASDAATRIHAWYQEATGRPKSA